MTIEFGCHFFWHITAMIIFRDFEAHVGESLGGCWVLISSKPLATSLGLGATPSGVFLSVHTHPPRDAFLTFIFHLFKRIVPFPVSEFSVFSRYEGIIIQNQYVLFLAIHTYISILRRNHLKIEESALILLCQQFLQALCTVNGTSFCRFHWLFPAQLMIFPLCAWPLSLFMYVITCLVFSLSPSQAAMDCVCGLSG